ncbi:MAG: DUF1549 domain-containing protein, partial [Bryobacterales bacterium]|nr:DUF1549 domain-containing protein [Bryobacterales bacterium]
MARLAISQTSTPKLPESHPEVKQEERRSAAARLTAEMAGSTTQGPGAVPRRNLIDEHIFGKMQRDRIPHAPLATDEEFFRRIHIDLMGRIPSDEKYRAFVADKDPNKRDKLIEALVGSKEWRARWTYWFGDVAMAAANRIGNEG